VGNLEAFSNYGYLDYNSKTRSLTPQQLINRVDAAAGRRILDNKLNEALIRFKALIANK
jgi:hypothetical protein